MDWSEVIRLIEEKTGKTISEIARYIEVEPRYLHDIKAGKSKNPGAAFLQSLANKLGLNPTWLLTGEGPMFTAPEGPATAGTTGQMSNNGHLPDTPASTEVVGQRGNITHLPNATPHGQPAAPPATTAPEASPVRIVRPGELTGPHFLVPLLEQRVSAGPGAPLPDDDTPASYIPAPAYLSRYGRDVAALQVRGDSMEPTLKEGDMVVCDTYGWQGDGVYVIHMDGEGFVKRLSRRPGRLVIISDNAIYHPYDEPLESQALRIIGRVRCAVRKME